MIKVQTQQNVNVSNPVSVTLIDKSGAHVVLTMAMRQHAPISHQFSYYEGAYLANLPKLPPGIYECAFIVQAYQYQAMNGMYDSHLEINGQNVAGANGIIPQNQSFDSGFGSFMLHVQ
jgi:hypothetical protein